MFYSQFILAKKGPLGTIWIAAHLERKLRKNQVADTDIGVSVDSILFPDAPIALRLSSHLLLGVVRIYSKKVNYLFNDCSEALIKIKHAFRSTAVDLPPEESTAPYHSITLPENFDLDNFELPDSAFLDSNFVDHHISTREQITLQDTVNDGAFPTSKFGLDERFGDEDASPIGLELDEELFTEKKISPHHDEVQMSSKVRLDQGDTSVPSTTLELDVQSEHHDEKYSEIPNELSELLSNNYDKNCFSGVEDLRRDLNSSYRHGYTIQTPDLNEVFQPECTTGQSSNIPSTPYDVQTPCLVERAQEPSTPALLEEVIPSHLQEAPSLSPHERTDTCVESGKPDSCSSYMQIECSEVGNRAHESAKLDHKFGETAQVLPLLSALITPMSESLTPTYSNCNSITEVQQSGLTSNALNNISTHIHGFGNEMAINPSVFSHEAITLTSPPKLEAQVEADPATCNICADDMDVSGDILDLKRTPMNDSNEPTGSANLGRLQDDHSCISTSLGGSDIVSRSCGLDLHLPSLPFMQTVPSEAELDTSSVCTNSMDVSRGVLGVRSTSLRGGNEPTEVSDSGHLGDSHSCASTSVVGSDFLSRSCGSNLHLPGSPFMQTALLEAEPITSSICMGNIDVSGDTLDVKRTPSKCGNEPTEIALHNLEDGRSCASTSVVGSDFLPRSCGSNPQLPNSPFIQTATFEAEPTTSTIYTDSMDVSGVNLDLKRTPQTGGNAIFNLGRVEDVGSDFVSRSCGSNQHLPSSIFVDGALGDASELSIKDQFFSKKTPMRQEIQHISRSFEGQGEDLHYTNGQFINPDGQHISRYTAYDFKHCIKKPNELSSSVISKVRQLDNEKCSSSSEFIGPEKMLAPTFVDFPIYQALQGAGNGGIFDKNSNQLSRKRPLMDGPTVLQNNSSSKLPVLPSSKKRTDYIPDDDDVLTTILDGRSAPSLKTGSIPPLSLKTDSIPPLSSKTAIVPPLSLQTDSIPHLSKLSSQKRPRAMSKLGMPRRRKVLVDDAMVLHADAIRQQLINTEDIRRMRKKAPCTRPEIWKIYITAVEDDIFDRSILTGISGDLDSLCNLKYDVQKDSNYVELNPQTKTSGDSGSSRVLEFLKEMGDKEMNEKILSVRSPVNRNGGSSGITESATDQIHSDAQVDLHDQFQKLPVQPQVGLLKNGRASALGSSRALEFVDKIADKDRNAQISSVHSTNRDDGLLNITASATIRTHEVGAPHYMYDQTQKLPVHSPVGPSSNNQASVIGSSTDLEFLNEIGDNEINERMLSVHRNDGPPNMNKSSTIQTHEVGAQYNLYNQLQKLPVQPEVGPFRNDQASVTGFSRDLEFVNDVSDKERNARISSVHSTNRKDGTSNIIASATMQTNEVGAQHVLYDQLQQLPVRSPAGPFNNKIMSVIGCSTVLEFPSEKGDKEINGTSVHRNDSPSSMNESATVQTREVGAQYILYDQLQKLPAQPQLGPFRNDQASGIGSSRALEFANDMNDKGRNERMSSVHCTNRNDSPSTLTASATVQTSEVGARLDLYDQLQKLPFHSPAGTFTNNQTSVVGSSTVFEGSINERNLSVHRKDGPSSMNKSARVQTCEVGGQYNLHDQPQKVPVQPQMLSFSNDQDSLLCAMQPDAETCSTSIVQGNSIRELGRSISSVEKLTDASINRAEQYDTQDKTSVETGFSKFLEFHSDNGDTEMNERISSAPSILNRSFGSSCITESAAVQTNEDSTHCDIYGQLSKVPFQPQVRPFSNDQVSLISIMHPNLETHPTSIQEAPIRKCVSSGQKIIDKSINLTEEYDCQLTAPKGTGSSRFFLNEMSSKEMNERIVVNKYDGTSNIMAPTTVQTNEGDVQYDLHDKFGSFSNNQSSLTHLTPPDAEKRANSIILENPVSEIDIRISSVEDLNDNSNNHAERSLHNDAHNPLTSTCDGVASADCANLAEIDVNIAGETLISKSLIHTENLCNTTGTIINKEEKTGNIKHSESIHATDAEATSLALHMQDPLLVNRGTDEIDGSAVVVDSDGAVDLEDERKPVSHVTYAEKSGDEWRPVSEVTNAEKNRDEGRSVSDVTCAEHNIAFFSSSVNHTPSTVDENNAIKDFKLEGGIHMDGMPVVIGAAQDSSDFCSAIDDDYTGFLNEDDEAVVNEAGDKVPNPEDAQSLENSGWSARTRGVARYLKNLFDEESGQGRKSVVVNRLLVGKTRKEASRMFFETLVLKTRDYIQVEQEKSYEYINIMPRIKLLKSEF